MLAQHYGGSIVPWVFRYEGLEGAVGARRYNLLRLLLRRLTAPLGTIHCRRGRSSDLKFPQDPRDRDGFSCAVQAYYRENKNNFDNMTVVK
jgi:capsular polysaccharide export protein